MFDPLLYFTSYFALAALFASATAVLGLILYRGLRKLGRLVRAVTPEE